MGGLAHGRTEIGCLLNAADVQNTAAAVRRFGATVERGEGDSWTVTGAGGFNQPSETIDCGNSGTAARLLLGAAAGYKLSARFDGDASLRKRPMNRVIAPLTQMGARFDAPNQKVPLIMHGGRLKGITYRSPVSSAQVKSAVLLAGLEADGETVLIEPERSRDHTERMLGVFGAEIDEVEIDGARHPRVRASKLTGANIYVPGDPSSAAFPAAAALIVAKSKSGSRTSSSIRFGSASTRRCSRWARRSPMRNAAIRSANPLRISSSAPASCTAPTHRPGARPL